VRDSKQEKIDAEDTGLHAILSIRAEIRWSFNGDVSLEREALRAQADALIDRMRAVVDARSAMCNELSQAA
jgi:hypothetical protein